MLTVKFCLHCNYLLLHKTALEIESNVVISRVFIYNLQQFIKLSLEFLYYEVLFLLFNILKQTQSFSPQI